MAEGSTIRAKNGRWLLTKWLRRVLGVESLLQSGSGATGAGESVVAGEGGFANRGNIYGNIYHTYQSSPGRGILSQSDFEGILHDYLHWVYQACSKARLYGLESLQTAKGRPVRDLSEVFVPLTLRRFAPLLRHEVEEAAKEMQEDPAHAYLRLAEAKRHEGEEVPLATLLTITDKIAIIGGAGSGKSTILQYLAFSLARAALTNTAATLHLPTGKSGLVPLIIPLRYFREYGDRCAQSPQKSLEDPRSGTLAGFLPWYLKRRGSPLEVSADFIDRLLLGGGCLLMLDGLDEVVSRDVRGRVREQVENLVNEAYPGNIVLVTAREAGYRENAVFGDDFVRLDVQRLDDEQLRFLVTNWCRQLYPEEVDQRTYELISAIEDINARRADRDLPPLVSTPLMTTMVVSVKWGEAELPRERAKLYEACVKVILQAQYIPEDEARTELVAWGGAWEEQRNWLSTLALAMHEGGRASAAISESRVREVLSQELAPESLHQFLEAVRHRGGLLEERAELFQFVHLTFQEFLVARWLAKLRRDALSHLHPHLVDGWWREVVLLTYGFAQADYAPFAREYLEWLSTQTGNDAHQLAGLELAGAALLEQEKPNPELRRQQAQRLADMMIDPAVIAPALVRVRAGDTLARLGDPRFRADAWHLPDEPLLGFVEIPAGPFLMGSDPRRDDTALKGEQPQHTVTLPRYYIARYPVTMAQFRAFVEHSGHQPEEKDSLNGLANHPVGWVTWHDALAYCRWLTERLQKGESVPEEIAQRARQEGWEVTLPSEAEWEKAARGTEGSIYPWGKEWQEDYANTGEVGINNTSAVGSFPQGGSPYECLDMAGNVWEWTRSLWGEEAMTPKFSYPYNPADGREDLDASDNVLRGLRGGSCFRDLRFARCACRWFFPNLVGGDDGFRVVVLPKTL